MWQQIAKIRGHILLFTEFKKVLFQKTVQRVNWQFSNQSFDLRKVFSEGNWNSISKFYHCPHVEDTAYLPMQVIQLLRESWVPWDSFRSVAHTTLLLKFENLLVVCFKLTLGKRRNFRWEFAERKPHLFSCILLFWCKVWVNSFFASFLFLYQIFCISHKKMHKNAQKEGVLKHLKKMGEKTFHHANKTPTLLESSPTE